MIVSGNSEESQARIQEVFSPQSVDGRLASKMLKEWALSYVITQDALTAVETLQGIERRINPILGQVRGGMHYQQAADSFGLARIYTTEATSKVGTVSSAKERYLRIGISDSLFHEDPRRKPTESETKQKHLTRLALTHALTEIRPTNRWVRFDSPDAVANRLTYTAGHTLGGLSLLHEALEADENLMVVHFRGNSAHGIAGNPQGSGMLDLGRARNNIKATFPGYSRQIAATYSTLLAPSVSAVQSQTGSLRIPVSNVAPVVKLSVAEINEEGLYGPGDFETNQSPMPTTILLTGLDKEQLEPTDRMFERRWTVAMMGELAQKQLGLFH